MDVEQQRARGIGGVGGMHCAAGQSPEQIAIDRAEQKFAAFGTRAGTRNEIQNPGDLGAGKIRIDDQAGLRRNHRLMAFGRKPRAHLGGAAVLPDDGAMHGAAGDAIPHHRGLALVGDADGGDVARGKTGNPHRFAAGRKRRRPDVVGLVLDPARGREMLREFQLRLRRDRHVIAKDDRARRRGALIDGENIRHRRQVSA